MDIVITDISALEYHATPPAVRAVDLTAASDRAAGIQIPSALSRANAPAPLRIASREIMGCLKGVGFPIHVAADRKPTGSTPLLVPHFRSGSYGQGELRQVAEGIYVTSPARTLLDLARSRSLMGLALLMFEFLGIYARSPQTSRACLACDLLEANGTLWRGSSHRIIAYSNAGGQPLSFADRSGRQLPWEPCFTVGGTLSDLWKRPPLLTSEDLVACARSAESAQGLKRYDRAVRLALPGSASPEESLFVLMATAPRKLGGEGLPAPSLNRRVMLSRSAARAYGSDSCVGDAIWLPPVALDQRSMCVEIIGRQFHGDAGKDDARANALCASGVDVIHVDHAQMASLDRWEVIIDLIAKGIGWSVPKPTPAFRRQRARLRRELFGEAAPAARSAAAVGC